MREFIGAFGLLYLIAGAYGLSLSLGYADADFYRLPLLREAFEGLLYASAVLYVLVSVEVGNDKVTRSFLFAAFVQGVMLWAHEFPLWALSTATLAAAVLAGLGYAWHPATRLLRRRPNEGRS